MKSKNNNDKKGKKNLALVIFTALLIVGVITAVFIVNKQSDKKNNDYAYTQLLNSINEGTVEKIEMKENSETAKIKLVNEDKEKEVLIPSVDSFIELVQEKVNNGSKIELIQKEQNVFARIFKVLVSFLPTIILVILAFSII